MWILIAGTWWCNKCLKVLFHGRFWCNQVGSFTSNIFHSKPVCLHAFHFVSLYYDWCLLCLVQYLLKWLFFSPKVFTICFIACLLFSCSNVLAGNLFGIPLRGTHSHAFVSSYMVSDQSFLLLITNGFTSAVIIFWVKSCSVSVHIAVALVKQNIDLLLYCLLNVTARFSRRAKTELCTS